MSNRIALDNMSICLQCGDVTHCGEPCTCGLLEEMEKALGVRIEALKNLRLQLEQHETATAGSRGLLMLNAVLALGCCAWILAGFGVLYLIGWL